MPAGAHKKFERVQLTEIYLLSLKVQYKHKMKLPFVMASKHVLLYPVCIAGLPFLTVTMYVLYLSRSHSSDSKKGNLPARNVGVRHSSRTPNKDARSSRERIRTRSTSYGASEKTGSEISPRDKCKGDVNSAKNRNNQGDSCSTSDRCQTNSAPSSGKNTGDHNSESSRRNKTDSNVKNANCGKNTKNCSSRCSDSCSTNDRRQTNSAPSSSKNTGDHNAELDRRNKTYSNVRNANSAKDNNSCSSRCSNSSSTNDRRRTNSDPSSSKNTGDQNSESARVDKTDSNVRNDNCAKNNENCSSQCSDSRPTNNRRRTKSAPSSSKNTGHHNSQLGRKNKTDSNVRNANCGKDTKNCSSQCSDLRSANDRRRTNSATSSSKNTAENNSELGRRNKTDSNVRNAYCAKNTKNCSSQCSDSCPTNDRRRTNSDPSSSKNTGDHNSELVRGNKTDSNVRNANCTKNNENCSSQCSDSRPTNDRRRTNSAPCGSNTTRDHNSEFGDKTDSDMTTGSCSTQVNGKRKRTAPSNSVDTEQNKRQCIRPGTAPVSSNPQTSAVSSSVTPPANSQNLNLPSLENLSTFSHIIFIDLDNWGKFFKISYPLPPKIFVWGFCGGNYTDTKKISGNFRALLREKRFFQHPKCGRFKNAADFALCVQAARMDLQLPIHIPFTVLSGDKGFCELQNQLRCSARKMYIVDPHREDLDILQGIIASIGDT